MVNKRKKVSRQRGSHTHGWGAKKKHRGAGHRGGRGRAGSGKRGDAKKPRFWKNKNYFGKKGFKKKGLREEIVSANIIDIEENLEEMVSEGVITKQGDVYIIEASKAGFNKLLGKGKVTKKFKITIKYISKIAVEKIKKAGGEIITTK